MKVHLALTTHNIPDWDRVLAGDFDRSPTIPDADLVEKILALGDMAEPLGFDGIWVPEHFSSPYGMMPNPLQILGYFAGRTERVSLGTMVLVLPWWNPIRLAHQIAYLDILSKGRYDTIGLGRGVAKREFDALGIQREESRERFSECLDILELALTTERFSYDGKIFKVPETSLRPQARTRDLTKRFFGASATNTSLEAMARRGLRPLFVGNKPLTEAVKDMVLVNRYRIEEGMAPCQSRNILFMYCAKTSALAQAALPHFEEANRSVAVHYDFGNPNAFTGIKSYEAYAAGTASASAVTDRPSEKKELTVYNLSNILLGTPDEIIERVIAGQKACSFEEIAVHAGQGGMPFEMAKQSIELFAKEVLPVLHKMAAPLHASAVPAPELSRA